MPLTALLIYASLLVSSLVANAFVPLAPVFADELGLSATETGVALAASTIPLLMAAGLLGVLSDRTSARTLTIHSSVLLTSMAAAQAFAFDFWSLVVARLLFGVGLALVWTAGLAWLAQLSAASRRPRALSWTIAVAGAGVAAGPVYAGVLANRASLEAPFLIGAAGCAVIGVGLALSRAGEVTSEAGPLVRETLRSIWATPLLLGGIVAISLGGVATSSANLLVPYQLTQNGHSIETVGLLLSISSALFAVACAWVAHQGVRVASLRSAGVAAAILALAFIPVIASTSTEAVTGFLFLRVPAWALLSTIPYALCAIGAMRASLGYGAVIGVLTQFWAVTAALGPIAAGAIVESGGTQWAYAVLALSCAASALWLVSPRPIRGLPHTVEEA